MKKAFRRFLVAVLESAIRILPYFTAWVLWRLRG